MGVSSQATRENMLVHNTNIITKTDKLLFFIILSPFATKQKVPLRKTKRHLIKALFRFAVTQLQKYATNKRFM